MNSFKYNSNRTFIAIQPHHLNALRYFDKLYDPLLNENIEIFYIFRKDSEMENY